MISKYEGMVIFASVGLMAFALLLLRIESIPQIVQSNIDGRSQVATLSIVDENNLNENNAMLDALGNSVNAAGELTSLIIDDVVFGTGAGAKIGDTLTVHYIGTLPDGQQFDNSRVRGLPFSFTLGENQVIKGWEKGLLGMKVGGDRILVIPSYMAYGSRTVGTIPANSVLVFAVTLLGIK